MLQIAINRRLYKQFLLGTGVFNAELGSLIEPSEVMVNLSKWVYRVVDNT